MVQLTLKHSFIFNIFISIVLVNAASYLVQLKSPSTFETLLKNDDTVKAVHHLRPLVKKSFSFGEFEAFSGSFESDVLARLRKNPLVQEITADIIVKTCNNITDIQGDDSFLTQEGAPRHLARLSSRLRLDDEQDSYKYFYPEKFTGKNVNAYIIDTGIECENSEFEGRCTHGEDFTGEGLGDMNGHGTHVSGIIGSKTYGVAKNINLVEVKALDNTGTGSLSSIISGIEFAVNHHSKQKDKGKSGVINLSIGAFRNSVLNKAVEVAFKSGLVLVAAAGNSNIDACATSPASAKYAITVGAIDDRTDNLASFSNWGRCVNILASGVRVASINTHGPNPLLLSGTSMACPSITGLVGLMLEAGVPVKDVKSRSKEASTLGVVPRLSLMLKPITPNRVAYIPYDELDSDSYNSFRIDGVNGSSLEVDY